MENSLVNFVIRKKLRRVFLHLFVGGLSQHVLIERTLTLETEWPELDSWLYSFLSSYRTDLFQFLQNKMGTTAVMHIQ